ncbi:hypothetical protein PRZ48_013978 [Zasmidium cellare]|uniref:Uncharacterized protein n=1 Tax=Zasmidium cellare TaxID=395010 RepID=A0ABR0DZM9_ZASCE|nr:hypothetical protein PRZ48_013978 [Zasmidium cellare]
MLNYDDVTDDETTEDNTTNDTATSNAPASQDDNAVFKFSRPAGPCKFCNVPFPPEQGLDPHVHWKACSGRNREALKSAPQVYQEALKFATSEYQKLRAVNDSEDLGKAGRSILWILRGIEVLGENNYLATLEHLDRDILTTGLQNEMLQFMIAVLRDKGDNLGSVLALEEVLWYRGEAGYAAWGGINNVDTLSDWRVYEVELMKNRCGNQGFDDIWKEYANWTRVKADALPGRTELAMAVWVCKLKLAGENT